RVAKLPGVPPSPAAPSLCSPPRRRTDILPAFHRYLVNKEKTMKSYTMTICLMLGWLLSAASVQADKPTSTAATPAPKLGKDNKPQEGFMKLHASYVEATRKGGIDVLFLGDSITYGWRSEGKTAWARHIAPLRAANFGIGGDRTQHVLWRILNGELEG